MIFNHNDKNKAYEFIFNKFQAKLTTVKANKLNHADRLTYIQLVLSSIPVYYMSTILFSKTFVEKITAIIRRFWWTGVQEDNPTSPIAFRSWDDICQSKENGGLGIRDLYTVNKSLIINTAYKIAASSTFQTVNSWFSFSTKMINPIRLIGASSPSLSCFTTMLLPLQLLFTKSIEA